MKWVTEFQEALKLILAFALLFTCITLSALGYDGFVQNIGALVGGFLFFAEVDHMRRH